MTGHNLHMNRCLELAIRGLGTVAPNPLVGCVIVENGKAISEGWHRQYGGPHAEVDAIQRIDNQEHLKNCTLYVNLEPCAHHGKTPPCVDLIIEKKIPYVVIGCQDPNPLVGGRAEIDTAPMRKNRPVQGMRRSSPPYSSMLRVWVA